MAQGGARLRQYHQANFLKGLHCLGILLLPYVYGLDSLRKASASNKLSELVLEAIPPAVGVRLCC